MKSSKPAAAKPDAAPPRRAFRGIAHADRLQQRREQLIEAGLEAFGTRGFHATTVRDICTGAKLTERYYYESFRSLEALFSAVYVELNRRLKQATLDALAKVPPTGDAAKFARAALRVLLEFVRDDPRRARIMLIDAVSISHDVQRLSGEITRDYALLVRSFIDRLFPDAKAKGVDVDVLAAGLLGANIHIATHWVSERFATPLDTVLRNNLLIYEALVAYWDHVEKPAPAAKARPGVARPSRR